MFRFLLFFRGIFNLLLGGALLLDLQRGELIAYRGGGLYAAIDGILGIALALALVFRRSGVFFSALTSLDALTRLLIGLLILNNPGVLNTALGSALFMTGVIVACSIVGGLGVVQFCLLWLYAKPHGALPESPRRVELLPALLTSLAVVALGVGIGCATDDAQRLLAVQWYSLAIGVAFVLAALFAGRRAAR